MPLLRSPVLLCSVMKLLRKAKDGGPDSTVTGYWLVEWKRLFSIVLLRFDNGTRDAFHTHAFNSLNWVLWGSLLERFRDRPPQEHEPGCFPVVTSRGTYHQVVSVGTTWVLSFRGPWAKTWREYIPATDTEYVLSDGRRCL